MYRRSKNEKIFSALAVCLCFTLLVNTCAISQAAGELHEYWVLTVQLAQKIINGDVIIKSLNTPAVNPDGSLRCVILRATGTIEALDVYAQRLHGDGTYITNVPISAGNYQNVKVGTATVAISVNASGIRNGTNFLRDDYTWQATGGGGPNFTQNQSLNVGSNSITASSFISSSTAPSLISLAGGTVVLTTCTVNSIPSIQQEVREMKGVTGIERDNE